ncbi:cation acetate symporter [Thermocrispum agreste]|jgi:Na+(H+)/acetate symporter ActP|uniref:Cation acetate symporter n=3 Tax=Thermocrispum agreste TaxID=37925 RepID=A0ABD6FE46_9PSEU|nr:cation acetate symporter [Thermocrispum agreste]
MVPALAVAAVIGVTLFIGLRGVAAMRTTSDFLVASRRVTPLLNAGAVSGEYLSAASFLGVAGLMLKDGMGALWYPVGFTAGYILMLVLVAAPMRRSGALTVPDFAEARLASPPLRKLAAVVVLVIGALYLVPQFRTAGLVLTVVSGTPYWFGVTVAGAAVAATLALGGMRAATYVQAFQFVLKLLLFIIPAVWLLATVGEDVRHRALNPEEFTHFERDTTVTFRVDATLEPGGFVPAGTRMEFPAGAQVPHVVGSTPPGGEEWQLPLLDFGHSGYPLLGTLAVLVATSLGTMGLPHVIMRFHTSPDGRAARRTAAITVGLLGVFYLFPGIYGVLGRVLVPHLYLSGATDTAVVAMPLQVDSGWRGTLFTTLLTAGAFAAFLATSLGLLLAVSGAIAHDLSPGGLGRLRVTVLAAAAVVVVLALFAAHLDAGLLVTWGFTVAASTFSPLLVLGIWWPRLTAPGAICGVAAGLLSSSGAIAVTLFGPPLPGVLAILVTQPAMWTVPLAAVTMVLVSLRGRPPAWAMTAMLRLHLDEAREPMFQPRRGNRSAWSSRRWWTVRRMLRRSGR